MSSEISKKSNIKRGLFVGLFGFLLLVGGFGARAVLTKISGAIVAEGQIEVDQNWQVIQHPDGEVVAAIVVDEGQTVTAGDILLQLDPTVGRSELTIVKGQLFELIARRGRLEAERDGTATIVFDPLLITTSAENAKVYELMQGQSRLFAAGDACNRREIDQMSKRLAQIIWNARLSGSC